jgi:arabinogalactan endo-1,4-beta-galactosidase
MMKYLRMMGTAGLVLGLAVLLLSSCQSSTEPEPPFYFGVDLSYANEMDDCGAVYRENGELRDVYELFSDHGANLVRARLWHNPDWTDYSTPTDVARTFTRAQNAGMATLLDFHYSDNWADPGKQAIPAAWEDLTNEELSQAVYQYTSEVLIDLHEKGLMPDFVQVGNETNSGILKRVGEELDWPRDAELFNAGMRAVRDVADETGADLQIILHVAQPENAGWWFREARDHGITDFDIIGLSYYPQWSAFSIADVGAHVTQLRQEFGKEVLIVETAYPWTLDAVEETADNILNQGVREYSISIEGQRQFMIDLTQSLISNGALGVVYWEPAWVSTECSTRWGQGSHWENATFFDFQNNNEVHQGIEFLSYPYQFPAERVDGVLDDSYGEPLLQDEAGDNLDHVPHLDLLSLHARDDATSLYLGLTIAEDVYADPWGNYLIYFDTTQDEQGADVEVDKRPISVADPYQPEYRLDIQMMDRKGTVSGHYEFYAWDGSEWHSRPMTGGAAISRGSPAIIELQIPKSLLDHPASLNLGVVSTGRGRVHTAGDILGTETSPSDWREPVTLDVFATYTMSDSP